MKSTLSVQTSDLMRRGQAAVQAQNLLEAERWFREAMRVNPNDPQIKACVGQTLCWQGRRREGLAMLLLAADTLVKKARKSRDIGLLLSMSEQFQFWNDWVSSLSLLKKAVAINPSVVRGHQLLALTHSRLNQPADALEAGRMAVKLAPDNAMLQILLATLEAGERQHAAARVRLERVLERKLTAEEAFRAHKELATVLDKLKVYERVFPHLEAAAEICETLAEVQKQDRAFVPNMLRVNAEQFDRELLHRWAGAEFPGPAAPVFVLGFMRSGTTLTQEVLGAHPDVFVVDENDIIVRVASQLEQLGVPGKTNPERLRALDFDGIVKLREYYWQQLRSRHGNPLERSVVVDKTTMNTIDIGLINLIFPDAKVVFVIRDPRDICLSCFMQIMQPGPSTVHLFGWQSTARFYGEMMDFWLNIRERLSLQVLEIRYEDAVSSFEETFGRVLEFAGLAWDGRVTEFHRKAAGKYIASPSYAQVAQPLYTSSLQRWKRYEPAFDSIRPILEPYVKHFGYT